MGPLQVPSEAYPNGVGAGPPMLPLWSLADYRTSVPHCADTLTILKKRVTRYQVVQISTLRPGERGRAAQERRRTDPRRVHCKSPGDDGGPYR